MEIVCRNVRQTQSVAKNFAKLLKGGEILALAGQLGSGKTTFIQGLAKELGVVGNINSPTFVLLKEYPFKKNGKNLILCHFDAYRLKKTKEIEEIGLADYFKNKNVICVIEWADKIKSVLGKISAKIIWIKFEYIGKTKRRLKILNSKYEILNKFKIPNSNI
jgi:tRNA threonylcarbamoyladenosine biosynthesis protein TsaE